MIRPQNNEGFIPVHWMESTAYDIPVAHLDTTMPWQNIHAIAIGAADQSSLFTSRALAFVEGESES